MWEISFPGKKREEIIQQIATSLPKELKTVELQNGLIDKITPGLADAILRANPNIQISRGL